MSTYATVRGTMTACTLALWYSIASMAQPLTIYDIQYTTDPEGASPYANQVVDCVGGVVVAKFAGYRPRLVIQDPSAPNGWGGIQVKDWIYPFEMFAEADLGDWIELTNMLVEEFRGTTMLQRQAAYNPGYRIVSRNNPLPPPLIVAGVDIAAPRYQVHPTYGEGWYVDDHAAEFLESMRVIVRDIVVTDMDLGKAVDNYRLEHPSGGACWATDYMNANAAPGPYHPFVTLGQHFCAVGGILEQYTYLPQGWDYYQLVTQATSDLAICGDANGDGIVDFQDFARLEECLTGPQCELQIGGCNPPAWTLAPGGLPVAHCLMMDLDYDGDVDLSDLFHFQTLFGQR